jgi:hypothetical protein
LGELELAVKRQQRDIDDLDERFASFKGRVNKREALASAPEPAVPSVPAAPGGEGKKLTVAALRTAGRWPL